MKYELVRSNITSTDMMTALDKFERETTRTMLPKEFRAATGLTGRKARFEYALYRSRAGKRGRTAAVAQIQDENLYFKSRKKTAKGWRFDFETQDSIAFKDTPRKNAVQVNPETVKTLTQEEKSALLEMLLKDAQGVEA